MLAMPRLLHRWHTERFAIGDLVETCQLGGGQAKLADGEVFFEMLFVDRERDDSATVVDKPSRHARTG
jgi:hypothetical protein